MECVDAVKSAAEVGWRCCLLAGVARQPRVDFLFWFAVAVYALVGSPGKLNSPVSSLVRVPEYFQQFHGVGGFPPAFHPWFSLAS